MTTTEGKGNPSDSIAQFWSWFTARSAEIAGLLDDSQNVALIREISRHVTALHEGLGWEVGPGAVKEYQFVISPNRSRERLSVTRAIVTRAPALPLWELFAAKPPKSWNLELEIREGDRRVRANCRNWQYRLTGFSGNAFFDVELYPNPLEDLTEQTYARLGVLLVEGEVGEELLIERIDRIKVVTDQASPLPEGLTPIVYLHQHLLDIMAKGTASPESS